jgi:hypothetical protein
MLCKTLWGVEIYFDCLINPIVETFVTPCDEPTDQVEKEDNNMLSIS